MSLSRTTLLVFLILFCSCLELPALPDSDLLELSFWPGPGAARDPRTRTILDHPCGRVVVARVAVLPDHSKRGALIPEVAVELNTSGRVLTRWPVPVDSYPIAFAGNRLLLNVGELKLWVNPGGVIARYAGKDSIPGGTDVPCSRKVENSAYIVCQSLPDLRSGRKRIVQFESPCT